MFTGISATTLSIEADTKVLRPRKGVKDLMTESEIQYVNIAEEQLERSFTVRSETPVPKNAAEIKTDPVESVAEKRFVLNLES